MAIQVQLRRGTTAQNSTFTGAVGEVTVDTTKDTLVVHDGSTAGGFPLVGETGDQTITGIKTFDNGLKTDTISEETSAAGVTIDGVLLKDGGLNTSGAVVFNDAGADVDFRVEGDTDANLLFVDASADSVGINASTPRGRLHIGGDLSSGATDAAAINLKQTSTTAATGIYLERSGERKGYYIYLGGDNDSLTFQRNNTGTKADTMALTRDGNVGIGTSTPSEELHVYRGSATGTYLRAENTVGILYAGVRDTGVAWVATESDDPLTFGTNGTERIRITSNGALAMSAFPSNGNGVRIYSYNNQSVASGGTVTITGVTAGAVLVMVWNNSEGSGLMCFGSNDQTMQKIAGTGEATDTGSSHAIYKSAGSSTITYKNKYGGTRNVWIAIYAALAT